MRPIHPGEILREEYLQPLNMTPNALAKALHLHAARINEIVRENRGGNFRHRITPCPILWHYTRILVESSNGVRPALDPKRCFKND